MLSLVLDLYGREGIVNLPWRYPPFAERLLQTTAGTLTPLAMTAIGFQLSFRLRPTLRMHPIKNSLSFIG